MNLQEIKNFPLKEYESRYKVLCTGKILSNRTKNYMKTFISNGYEIIAITKLKSKKMEQHRVDVIVATAFYGESNLYLEHIDGNKLNNNSNNLRWVEVLEFLSSKYGGIWKPINDYEKYYISSDGEVWSSFSEQILKQQLVSGYMSVNIGYPKQLFKHVHRLVGMTFIPNPNNYPIINHKDENKMNNKLDNLEWVTSSENRIHSIRSYIRVPFIRSEKPEKYLELEDYKGYLLTEEGQVYSTKTNQYLKQHLNDNGYYRSYLNGKYYYTHKLIAKAYLEDPLEDETQVNHKNMNRLDNRVENLEWISASKNVQHSVANNPAQFRHLQKKVAQIDISTNTIVKEFNGIKEASRITKINSGSIVKACSGVRPTAGKYKWKYVK